MIDDTNDTQGRTETIAGSTTGSGLVGYCQECGRGLTVASLQRLNGGVFCPTCATQRQTAQGWQAVPAGAFPRAGRPGPVPPGSTGANPVFAGLLGLIPGVGAMYNAQYAKGAMHLIVFVVLVSMADHLNWVFYWLVWGWVFYQAFDAYHTARARRDGLPPPNPFGWNDIGEKLGFGRPQTTPPPPFTRTGPGPGFASSASHPTSAPWAGYAAPTPYTQPVPPPVPPTSRIEEQRPSSDNPYNPYAAPYDSPVRPTEPGGARPLYPNDPGPVPSYMSSVPYAPTYIGVAPKTPAPLASTGRGQRRFPIGAIWLIGLGTLFLLGNVMPGFHLSASWLVPLMLAALALWGAFRRWEQFRVASGTLGRAPNLAAAMTGPSVLLTLAFLLTLDAADLIAMHRSWPVLLVVWGGMLLLQRATTPAVPLAHPEIAEAAAPQPMRSTSGTGSLGL